MSSRSSRIFRLTGALGAGAASVAYTAYRKEMTLAKQRIEKEAQVIETPNGPIEFGESGDGPAVLLIHGAAGGFDQGLDIGRGFLGDGIRIIAPSRFGYLGTPMPDDASAEAQADAHARLLEALKLDPVPVIGISAGAPSAMQLCIRHPERCSALILVVPLAYPSKQVTAGPPSRLFKTVLKAISSSDFVFWTATKLARTTLLETILGTPASNYRRGTPIDHAHVDELLRDILPISRRLAGLANDGVIGTTLTRYALEDIRVPTLVISTMDCLYATHESSVYTTEHVAGAKLIVFRTGGHLLLGHDADVRAEVGIFLREVMERRETVAM